MPPPSERLCQRSHTSYGGVLTGQSSHEPPHPSLHLVIASSRLVSHKTKASLSEFDQGVESVALPPSKARDVAPAQLPHLRGCSTVPPVWPGSQVVTAQKIAEGSSDGPGISANHSVPCPQHIWPLAARAPLVSLVRRRLGAVRPGSEGQPRQWTR